MTKTKSGTRANPQKKPPGATMPATVFYGDLNMTVGGVMMLAEAAAFLRASEDDVRRMAERGMIPAKRVGEDWRFLESALRAWLSEATPMPVTDFRTLNEQFLALAGAWADDTSVPKLREIMNNERGRQHHGESAG